jgi:hypothetical protein
MNLLRKLLLPSIFAMLSFFLSYKLVYWVAENYFFDNFFYRKSWKHGYYLQKGSLRRKEFLKNLDFRMNDLIEMRTGIGKLNSCLIREDMDKFSIALIGDSYLYGMGVKNDERVSEKLMILFEEEFPERKVEIVTLAKTGNSVFDYYIYSNRVKYYYNPDVFVYVLVNNDTTLKYEDYDFELYNYEKNLLNKCEEFGTISNSIFTEVLKETNDIVYANTVEWETIVNSWTNPANICIANKVLDLLPNNSLFVVGAYYVSREKELREMNLWQYFLPILSEKKVVLLYPDEVNEKDRYEKFWSDPEKFMQVSSKDHHPSKILHQIYADLLFEEIITNPRWGFIEN